MQAEATGESNRSSDAFFELQEQIHSRKRLEQKLALLEEFNQHLIETTGDCIMLVNREGKIQSLNKSTRELLEIAGERECYGMHWTELFREIDVRSVPPSLYGRGKLLFQSTSKTLSGTMRHWSFTFNSLGGDRDRLLLIARDITEQVSVEKALRLSEEAFRRIFEENPIGILLATLNCQVMKANDALCGMLGYCERELIGKEIFELAADKKAGEFHDKANKLLEGELRVFEYERELETKSKERIWAHLTTSIVRHGASQNLCILQMIENIQARKQSEEQVLAYQEKLQSLASELSLSEERERRRIATNLHDRIGQSLAFARLKLGSFGQNNSSEAIREIRELIEQAIVDTRSLTFELSPPVLYELGLVPAVEWLARRIEQEHGIPTRFQDDGQEKPLDDNYRVVLFQGVRELLVNVVKHARASHAVVMMRRDADALRIVVEDDGAGFNLARLKEQSGAPKSFGLFNIRERLEYLGGKLQIRTEPKRGTRVTLIAPLKMPDQKQEK